MANKIGRFEILSEIVRSEFSVVYKASDPESGQTIALKTIQLQMLGDQASVLVDQILREAESTKPLNSHNIALLYGLEKSMDSSAPPWSTCRATALAPCWRAKKDFPSGTCRTLRGRLVRDWTTLILTTWCTTASNQRRSW